MKATLMSKTGEKKGELDLPIQFNEVVREDLIQRAVLSIQSKKRTPYGAYEFAGMRHSARNPKRRRKYRGTYGTGMSRVPRKTLSRSGSQFHRAGAFAPGTVGGRRSHPPKACKIIEEEINTKENRKAIRSAMSATTKKELLVLRGHNIPTSYPLVFESSVELFKKTKEVEQFFDKLGLTAEVERCSAKKVRAGVGKLRNRRYKTKIGVLIVVEKPCDLQKACSNLPGVSVVGISSLNAEDLAPGAVPGRVTLWSKSAIDKIEKEKMFV